MFAKIRLKLKGWKTVAVNAMLGLPASLLFVYEQFQGVDVTPLIPAQYAAGAVAAMAILGVLLRILTTGPIGHKGDAEPAPDTKAGDRPCG
jgi:hypothetical protein